MNRIIVQKDQARLYGQPCPIPQGQSQFSEIEFSFSEEWANLRKIAQFEQKSGPYNVDISDNKCFCPSELVKGWVNIRIKGYPEDTTSAVIATANEIILPVSMGFNPGGTPSVPPTPDLYQKLVEEFSDKVQSDWSQNDPSAKDYIKSRPGGYMTDPVITDADTFTITSAEGEDGRYMTMVAVESSTITLSDYAIGDGVIVDFGGQSYSLTWQSAGGMPACGAAVTDEGPVWSSVPFYIMAVFGEKGSLEAYYIYLQNAVTSPIQVKIKKAKQTPVKIPTKYLESDVYIVRVTSKSNEQRPGPDDAEVSYDVTVSATYDDIVAAINAGRIPILLSEPVLSEPVLRLVNHSTDDVDGSTPFLTFGGAYFHQQNRLYGTCVYIDSTGEATCRVYDGIFVRRFEAFEEASSQSVGKVLVGKKYSDYKYMWAAGDAVLCDEQTLTDAQKKQARDNIDATSSDFVINATVASDNTCTTDKTFAQIQEAVQSGKRAVVKAKLDGSDLILPQVGKFIGYYAFSTVFCYDASIAKQYTILLGQQDNGVIICRVVTYNSDDNLPQVNMAADPTEDMEIATKQYVDDHASGGTGMGITDAAVGQIAKITAVDASGVPTAWGPMDIPDGVPSVTAADNGKFLRVVSGAWAAATINNANGVSF